MDKKEETKISVSFEGMDLKEDSRTGKINYLTPGSIVIESDGKTSVYEQQIDTNPHPPVNKPHLQQTLRASITGIRPKKIESEIISEGNHQPFKFSKTKEPKLKKARSKTGMARSPFRYAGGKFYARKLIMGHIPIHTSYIEPFCGGASIFFAKEKSKKSILNDKDEELTNCLIQIRDNPEKIADFLEGIPASKEKHNFFKNEFKPKNDIERASRWFYLNRTSYSGIMNMKNCYWGYGEKYSMRPENWRGHLLKVSEKLQRVVILNKDFQEVIENVPDGAFLFIDPPYFNRDQDKFYTISLINEDHKRLMELLKKHSNRINFLITYDDEPEIREMYSWAKHILEKEWNYMIYRTDDQTKDGNGEGKKHFKKRYMGSEIFILNYNSPEIESSTKGV